MFLKRLYLSEFNQIKVNLLYLKEPRALCTDQFQDQHLLDQESWLRRLAYSNTSLNVDASFFDDSDIQSPYYIIVVHHKKSKTPLLSVRYYFEKSIIHRYLNGCSDPNSNYSTSIDYLETKRHGEIFLADRLSGNLKHPIYKRYRYFIFFLLYKTLYTQHMNTEFFLMAKDDFSNRLLNKYLKLGLSVYGDTIHNGVKHWILLGNFNEMFNKIKLSNWLLASLKVNFWWNKHAVRFAALSKRPIDRKPC